MVSLVEKYAMQPQYVRKKIDGTPGNEVWLPGRHLAPETIERLRQLGMDTESNGGWTGEHQITAHALDVLRQVGSATDAEVERLYAVLQQLYDESVGKSWTGLNLCLLANTLHALRPERFPQHSRMGSSDNKLMNPADFGL